MLSQLWTIFASLYLTAAAVFPVLRSPFSADVDQQTSADLTASGPVTGADSHLASNSTNQEGQLETSPRTVHVGLGRFLLIKARNGNRIAVRLTEHTRPYGSDARMTGSRYVAYTFRLGDGTPTEHSGEVYEPPTGLGTYDHIRIYCGTLALEWSVGDDVTFPYFLATAVATSAWQRLDEVDFDSPSLKWLHDPLLLRRRPLSELSLTNLYNLCSAWNQGGFSEDQRKVAEEIWRRAPGDAEALGWMANSLLSTCWKPAEAQEIADFADMCLQRGYGSEMKMLLLKAEGLARTDPKENPERLREIRRLIFNAYTRAAGYRESFWLGAVFTTEAMKALFTPAEQEQIASDISKHWQESWRVLTVTNTFAIVLPASAERQQRKDDSPRGYRFVMNFGTWVRATNVEFTIGVQAHDPDPHTPRRTSRDEIEMYSLIDYDRIREYRNQVLEESPVTECALADGVRGYSYWIIHADDKRQHIRVCLAVDDTKKTTWMITAKISADRAGAPFTPRHPAFVRALAHVYSFSFTDQPVGMQRIRSAYTNGVVAGLHD